LKNQKKFVLMVGIFTSTLVISNVLAAKLWVVPYFGAVVPAGVIAYPITFLMTDVLGEVWGKKSAAYAVFTGFVCAILAVILGFLASWAPRAEYFSAEAQEHFAALFSSAGRITVASLVAYLVAQFMDVYLFHWLRDFTKAKHLWLRNNVATVVSQFFDTFIFIMVAFWGIMPLSLLVDMCIAQWVVKILLALVDTPFCYALVAWSKKEED